MEIKKVSEEMTKALKAPLPQEALKAHPTMQGLTAINQIYIIERLNEVFGIGSWQLRDELLSPIMETSKTGKNGVYKDYTSLVKVTFTIPEYNIHMECIAGSTNKDEGDSAKGGITDCITKIASWLGIGQEVYKNKHGEAPKKEQPKELRKFEDLKKTITDSKEVRDNLIAFIRKVKVNLDSKYSHAVDYKECVAWMNEKIIQLEGEKNESV
mgnify:CR=1 FL=1